MNSLQIEPIPDDDASIERALERASIPTLMVCLAQITGDTRLLEGDVRPRAAVPGDSQGGIRDEEKAEIRRRALAILKAWRDDGCKLPPPPSPETLQQMMSFLVGQEVPAEYVPMMLEEMELDGVDVRGFRWDHPVPDEARQRLHVLVIGAGMSGILTGIRLQEAGIPYTIVEKNPAVGGTWYENRYPGCRVDVANHFYCYSFAPNHDWPEFFSQRQELFEYFDRCADEFGLRPHIRFETEVAALRWNEQTRCWDARLRRGDGAEESLSASVVVSAVGQLNRPKLPEIPGRDSFAGPAMHSAAWDPQVELEGRRVAVIGSGASAFQLVPELAKVAGRLSVFQRSPAWMAPNPHYHAQVSEGKKWLLKHVPYYARWYRFLLFWPGSDGLLPSLQVDPDWPHPDRSINASNERQRLQFTAYLQSQVDDPELLEKVVPTYPPFGKRMLQDNGSWLSALQRENVELVTTGIREITEDAVVTTDGQRYPQDALVFATGFHANQFLWPMQVIGREGVELGGHWGEDPRAYLGMTMPGFPNLFCLYGPNTNLAHAGSIIFHSECQVRYIMGCIKTLVERDLSVMECRPEVHDAFNERLDEALARTVWAHPGMDSWYKNSRGRVTCTSPWRLVDYWRWTREPDVDDYALS